MQLKSELGLGSYHTVAVGAEYFIESAAKGYQLPKATLLHCFNP